MSELRLLLGSTIAIAIVALPSDAAAQPIVPPGNSAATQYTQAFPTAGGEQKAGGHKGKRTPVKVLGERNTRRLEAKGPQGRALATFAAETSPAPVAASDRSGTGSATGGGNTKHEGHGANRKGRYAGSGHGGGAGGARGAAGDSGARAALSNGSSGLGEVIGQAIGSSSSGQIGLLLPLVVIGIVLWSLAFLWRQKRRVT